MAPSPSKTTAKSHATPVGAQSDSDDEGTFATLRKAVTHKQERAWSHRGNIDVYRRMSRTETPNPEVDHIIEIQILDHVWREFVHKQLGGGATSDAPLRAQREHVETAANELANLNVTTHEINQKKKGPFTTWRNQLDPRDGKALRVRSLDQLCRTSHPEFAAKPVWQNILKAVEHSRDDVVALWRQADDPRMSAFVDSFEDAFQRLGFN